MTKRLLAIGVLLALSEPARARSLNEHEVAMAKAIRTAYLANRAAITHGQARFHIAVGKAATIEEAVKGDLSPKWVAQGLYALDGPNLRYENLHSLEDMVSERTKIGKNEYMCTISSERFVTNGELILSDRISPDGDDMTMIHTAQIDPEPESFQFCVPFQFPLDLGEPKPRCDLATNIDDALSGVEGWTLEEVDENAVLGGVPVCYLRFAVHGDNVPNSPTEYWIDLEHGAIPIQTVMTIKYSDSGEGTVYKVEGEIRNVGDGWLPFQETNVVPPGKDGLRLVRRITIDEADFTRPPDRAIFRMEFPEPRVLINSASMVRYKKQAVWDLDDLPAESSGAAERISLAEPPPPAPEMPGPVASRPWWATPLIAMGALLLVGSGLVFWRRRHDR